MAYGALIIASVSGVGALIMRFFIKGLPILPLSANIERFDHHTPTISGERACRRQPFTGRTCNMNGVPRCRHHSGIGTDHFSCGHGSGSRHLGEFFDIGECHDGGVTIAMCSTFIASSMASSTFDPHNVAEPASSTHARHKRMVAPLFQSK